MNTKIITLFLLLMLLALGGGCDRYIDSRDPVRSIPDSGPVPKNLTVLLNDQSISLSWEIANPEVVGMYRIYAAVQPRVGEESDFVLRDSTAARSIQLDQLLINESYYIKVAAVSTSGLEWEQSEAVKAVFTYLSIAIESGRELVKGLSVRVNINAPTQTSHIMLSEDQTFATDIWIPFEGTVINYELSDGDGTKWLYARLQFDDGSRTGNVLSDSIVVDTRATIDSVFFTVPANGEYFTVGETITFGVTSGEAGGDASISFDGGLSGRIDLYDDGVGVDPEADDGIYYGAWVVPVSYTLDHGEVTGRFTDEAGNSAPDFTASNFLTIFTPPQSVILTASPLSTFEISLTWTQTTSSAADFAAYRIYRHTTSAVSESSTLVYATSTSTSTDFTDTDLDDNMQYYYRHYIYDKSGLSAASDVATARTLVNTTPDPVELFVVDNGSETTTELHWTKSTESDFDSYRIYRPASALVSQPSLVMFTTLVWKGNDIDELLRAGISLPVATGNYFFVLYVFDKHGEKSDASNTVSAPAPAGE
ncbi:MAG: fibronectin type III domain-containing protein [candidate division Zixibacteria bacterium]|nr:fibronectin type III domain-containing protein [candidate division Zixibacteria bacterium]